MLPMLFVSVLAAGEFRVETCRHPLAVTVEASAPLFAGERRLSGVTCGTDAEMLYHDPERGKRVGRISVEYRDAAQVRVLLEDVRRGLRIERDIALDTPTDVVVDKGRHSLSARITVSAAAAQPDLLSVIAARQTDTEVAERAAAASGWTLRGTELLQHHRNSYRIDAISMRMLLTMIAFNDGVDVRFTGDKTAEFSRPARRQL